MTHRMTALAFTSLLGALTMSTQLVAQSSTTAIPFVTSQPANESLARVFLGANVTNMLGETVGDVNDVMFNRSGQISTVVLGVGGFLGMGEKIVAVPYSSLTISTSTEGARTIVISASKEALKLAPVFTATEKTTLDAVKDKAVDLGHKTADKANELKDQAAKKIDDMTKGTAVKK
jgi:sporulation protein YlmC with PRC-barrel domain